MPSNEKSKVSIHVWGELALFSRPEMKVERVSYDVITPSAARGVLEAIYWKPEIRWVIDRLTVLNPIRFTSLRRNEVKQKIPAGAVKSAMKQEKGFLGFYVDDGDNRQQRAATLLRDVAYLIDAHFEVLGGADGPEKHFEMFKRRATQGQYFHHPYLGCREFPCDFAYVDGDAPKSQLAGTNEGNRDLGFMLHDIDFEHGMTPRFFRATMTNGVIDVPPIHAAEVRS